MHSRLPITSVARELVAVIAIRPTRSAAAVTVFERRVSTVRELIDELKAGRYYPGQGLHVGQIRGFTA